MPVSVIRRTAFRIFASVVTAASKFYVGALVYENTFGFFAR